MDNIKISPQVTPYGNSDKISDLKPRFAPDDGIDWTDMAALEIQKVFENTQDFETLFSRNYDK